MNKGISILAFGNEGYMLWAVNLACTIRLYSPGLPIQLIASEQIINSIKANHFESVFDYFTLMPEEDFTDKEGKLFPAKAKLKLMDYFMFEKTIYLDADTALVRDVAPLFDSDFEFSTIINLVYRLAAIEETKLMAWCRSSVILQHYDLDPQSLFPSVNTSFMLIENTEHVQNIFNSALNNLLDNPIPHDKQFMKWGYGKGAQPDELYLNIALNQNGFIPVHEPAVYFRMASEAGPVVSLADIREQHYAIGLYGNEGTNHISIKRLYNAIVRPAFEKAFEKTFAAKSELLMKHKFANQKF
jgi:hypothetical protein